MAVKEAAVLKNENYNLAMYCVFTTDSIVDL